MIIPLNISFTVFYYFFLSFTELSLLFSAFTGFETNNKYEILNSLGQRIYHAVEGE